jgi:hypothetical protein
VLGNESNEGEWGGGGGRVREEGDLSQILSSSASKPGRTPDLRATGRPCRGSERRAWHAGGACPSASLGEEEEASDGRWLEADPRRRR